MNKDIIWSFLREIFNRLGQKNPLFFTVISWIGVAATVITGLPLILEDLGISLSPFIEQISNKIIAYCGIVVTVISNLTVKGETVKVTNQTITTQTSTTSLPFTAKNK